jgi:hypothetical protein
MGFAPVSFIQENFKYLSNSFFPHTEDSFLFSKLLRPLRENIYKLFFLNNQPDALIIPILFCYKTPYVLGIFSAHHQEFSTVHSALVSFMQVG